MSGTVKLSCSVYLAFAAASVEAAQKSQGTNILSGSLQIPKAGNEKVGAEINFFKLRGMGRWERR
jgi:hypothetical protein